MSSSQQIIRSGGWAAVLAAGLLTLSVNGPAQADQVYKSVDAQGHVTYSDRPNASGAQKTDVTVQQADPAEATRLAKERQLLNAEDDQRKKQQAAADKSKAQQDHDKQARCQAARDHYNALKDVGRLYKRDADGNRVYFSDAEADAQREAARQVMTTACGT
jgi:Skp family chaperone for outer membrane proteins